MNIFCPSAQPCAILRTTLRSATSGGALQRFSQPTQSTVRRLSGQTLQMTAAAHSRALSHTSRPRNDRLWSLSRGSFQQQCRTFFSPAIIRSYEDLPRDYRDKRGLQFRRTDLSDAEVERILGPGITASNANYLLRILHGRRVAGTLDDPVFFVHTAQFTPDQINKSLAYLRKTVPVDEVMNAGLRAEDELSELDTEKEEATNEPVAVKEEGTPGAEAAAAGEAETAKPAVDPVYGKSAFDQIRARNIARNKAMEKAREEEEEQRRLKAEAEGRVGPQSLVQVEEGQRAITNPKIAEYYKEATSDLKEAPDMSLWQRVAPSLVFVTFVLGFCASVCFVYQEPSDRYRLLDDISIEAATLGTIIAANILVLSGWRLPPLWKFFNKYMLLVVAMPKPTSLFTSMFSHKQFSHMFLNMVPLYLVGMYLHEDLGRATFVTLYLACGSVGFLGSLLVYAAKGMTHVTTMGASGATLGLLAAWFWDHRNEPFRIMGLPDNGVHGIVWWGLIVALHLAGAGSMFSSKDRIDLVSHFCGIIAGTLGIEIINWSGLGRKRTKEQEQLSDKVIVKDLATGRDEVVAQTGKR